MKEYIERAEIIKAIVGEAHHCLVLDKPAEARGYIGAKELIERRPAADVVEVTFCKDCRYYQNANANEKGFLICPASGMEITETDYCSYGERKIETVLPKSDAKDESLEVEQ